MNRSARTILVIAALLVATATAVGAFGAHGLKPRLPPERFDVFESAANYHLLHALGLLAVGLTLRAIDRRGLVIAAWLIIAGIAAFSGSLYALLAGAPRALGMITPIGGVLLMAGWTLCAVEVARSPSG